MEQTPKNFILDRRTQGILDIVKTNLEQLAVGAGFGSALTALYGEGKAITLVIPLVLTFGLTVARATVSRLLALSVTKNPIAIQQTQTVTADTILTPASADSTATDPAPAPTETQA